MHAYNARHRNAMDVKRGILLIITSVTLVCRAIAKDATNQNNVWSVKTIILLYNRNVWTAGG